MSTETPPQSQGRLKPIPMSGAVWWATFKRQIFPALVWLGVISAIVYQWRNLAGGGVQGVAEGVRSLVTIPMPSVVQDVQVCPYEWVEAGQPIAIIKPSDARARADLVQAELDIARLMMQPSMAQNNALDYERLRVDELRLREELNLAEVQLQLAESALRRNELLRKDRLVTEDAYELSLRDRDLYRAQITQKSNALAQVEARVAALRPLGEPANIGTNEVLAGTVERIRKMIDDVEAGYRTITLTAPISGMVSFINRQPGEFVAEGEPLMTINSSRSDRIVAYLRQPYPMEPEAGMPVEVVTRTRQRQRFISEITHVGVQLEPITNSLAYLRPGVLVDSGLPIVIGVPPDVSIRPGESVEIIFSPKSGNRPANSHAKQTL